MIEATQELPVRMRNWGCTLKKKDNGTLTKFVLENKARDYRSFIYVRSNYEAGAESTLNDLYSHFFYETGLSRIGNI